MENPKAIALQGVGFKPKVLALQGYRFGTAATPHRIRFAPYLRAKTAPLSVGFEMGVKKVDAIVYVCRVQQETCTTNFQVFTRRERYYFHVPLTSVVAETPTITTTHMTDFHIKRGDTLPRIESTLKYERQGKEEVVDLTGAQQVELIYRLAKPISSISTPSDFPATIKVGTILNHKQGRVGYQWMAGDTAVPGVYQAEWRITFAGGGVLSIPNDGSYISIQIVPSLA